jgi:hypothetical protein
MKNARVITVVARGIYKLDDGSFRVVAHVGNTRVNQRRREKRISRGDRCARDEALAERRPRDIPA